MPEISEDTGPRAAAGPAGTGRTEFVTAGGIQVTRTAAAFRPGLLAEVTAQIDERRGGVLSSGMEYPGRYSRWHVAYVDPCAELVARGRRISARALNARGRVLLPVLAAALARAAGGAATAAPDPAAGAEVSVLIDDPGGTFTEEQRSRRPTVFTALREVIAAFAGPDPHLGMYGAFGYDLAFQFEPVRLRHLRDDGQRDLVLHLPDQLYVMDRKRETAICYSYDFATPAGSTRGLPRATAASPRFMSEPDGSVSAPGLPPDPVPGHFAGVVGLARQRFGRGDLFEVVPSQAFHRRCGSPAGCYERLRRRNPAPYEFFWNLGEGEYLVGASPEMYVRVTGDRVETCPIAGTIGRGAGPLEDADNIRALLTSAKEEAELTMCTDVDRNDKSRVCLPGSVRVIGRRQIEMYSRVIHTVDHVEGRLRPGFDALDAFLTHMWAVTVTGAPKAWAMQFIEDHEDGPRRWYGGAVGMIGFDGGMNTGLTLRTAHIRGLVASVRAGATLLYDSDPAAEERETQLKAMALLETLAEPDQAAGDRRGPRERGRRSLAWPAARRRDARCCWSITRTRSCTPWPATSASCGAGGDHAAGRLRPGPAGHDPARTWWCSRPARAGRPTSAATGCWTSSTRAGSPRSASASGLQAMVEHAGGGLARAGRSGARQARPGAGDSAGTLLAGLPAEFTAGRYHSLHARRAGDAAGSRSPR